MPRCAELFTGPDGLRAALVVALASVMVLTRLCVALLSGPPFLRKFRFCQIIQLFNFIYDGSMALQPVCRSSATSASLRLQACPSTTTRTVKPLAMAEGNLLQVEEPTLALRLCVPLRIGKTILTPRWLGAAQAGHLAWKFLTGGLCAAVFVPEIYAKTKRASPDQLIQASTCFT